MTPRIALKRSGKAVVAGAALTLALTATLLSTPTSAPARSKVELVPTAAATKCGKAGKFAPKCGALWGVYTLQNGDPEQSVRRLESRVGRRFDLTLRYHDFSDHQHLGKFPDRFERRLGAHRRLFFSWQARVAETGRDLSWRAIANGKYDRFVKSAATRVKAYKRPVFIAFDAEFDNQRKKGSMGDYVAAYRHIHRVFSRHHVTNVAWAWVSTGYTGAGNGARILRGYPGDRYVNWVGWDPYNFYRCNSTGWRTFGQKVTPYYRWLQRHGHGNKPFLLSEYGTQYDRAHPDRSKRWHAGIPGALKKLPNLKALIRFDANGWFGAKKCGLFINNGPGSVTSFAHAGRVIKSRLRR